MMKQKPSLTERLNIGDEVRELKLGCTFNAKNTTNAFHTIKYDFKPASVDKNRVATVDVGSNNQVTVTVPNLVNSNSGVPHTIYKGNQKKYTKECILIYDKVTGDITIERLNHNIQVKKTRDVTSKPNISPLPLTNLLGNAGGAGGTVPVSAPSTTITGTNNKFENSTMRVTSKTKVSTGSRRNKIIELKGGNSNVHNCSPARNNTNKTVEAAPAWNANNGQSTLPSIPMIVDDDDIFSLNSNNSGFGGSANSANDTTGASVSGVSGFQKHVNNNLSNTPNSLQQYQQPSQIKQAQCSMDEGNKQAKRHKNQQQKRKQQNEMHYAQGQQNQQQQQQLLQAEQEQVLEWQRQLHQQQHNQQQQYNRSTNNNNNSTYDKNSSPPIPISSVNWHNSNTNQSMHNKRASSTSNNSTPQDLALSPTLAIEAAALEMNIVNDLSSSSSSSDSSSSSSDSSDTESDSDNDQASNTNNNNGLSSHQQQTLNQLPNLSLGILNSPPPPSIVKPSSLENHLQHHPNPIHTNYASNVTFPNDLLQNDLQLSSNSSDEDDVCNGD